MREKTAKVLLWVAAAAVLSSVFFPYWHLTVRAPQYPKGLRVQVYLDHVIGDVDEIDRLNHYIGMRPLDQAAKLEKKYAVPGIVSITLCLILAVFIPKRRSILFIVPAVFLPSIFAADLYLWLRDFGLHLDPHAALSSSVKPFVPPLLGQGKIAQFSADANFGIGHGLSMLSAFLSLSVIFLRSLKRAAARDKKTIRSIMVFVAMTGVLIPGHASCAQTFHAGTAAYPTIESAMEKASDGDTIVVGKGSYRGPLEITKSIRLEGKGLPVIDGGGRGTVVRVKAPDVRFEGFLVRGSGILLSTEDGGLVVAAPRAEIVGNTFEDVLFGIDLRHAPGSVVRDNRLRGKPLPPARRGDLLRVWYSDDATIERNTTFGGRDAVLWFSKNVTLRENVFQGGRYGLHFMYCADAVVESNRLEKNSVGAYLMYSARLRLTKNLFDGNRGPSGYGIGFKDMEDGIIEENVVSGNRIGLFLDACRGTRIERNLIAYNDTGAQLLPSVAGNTFAANTFLENGEQAVLDGQSAFTVNDWHGNYWSDYRGWDRDGDGIGDVPYRPVRLFERLAERFKELKVFAGGAAAQAIDQASRIFPVFAPSPKFTDERPLMRPAWIPSSSPARGSWLWTLFSGSLLLPLAAGFITGRACNIPYAPPGHAHRSASAVSDTVVQVRGLTKRYGAHKALDSLDLDVARGEALALWGPNGAGKTTLLRCLLGLIPASGGTAQVLGFDARRKGKEARRSVGYVPQEIRLHPDQTVWETLIFYAALRGIPFARAASLLDDWGLRSASDRYVQNLSGGMKQKLALAIALLSDPPILLLDEPTSNLDTHARYDFTEALKRLKTSGKTLIFCSHRFSEVRRLADRVVLLERGAKRAEGRPDTLRHHLGEHALVYLTVRPEDRAEAIARIGGLGLEICREGEQLRVRSSGLRKAEPFHALAQAGIQVLDFDIEFEPPTEGPPR